MRKNKGTCFRQPFTSPLCYDSSISNFPQCQGNVFHSPRAEGVGNIYRAEVLHRLKLHPLRPACSLSSQEVWRLWQERHPSICAATDGARIHRGWRKEIVSLRSQRPTTSGRGRKGDSWSPCASMVDRPFVRCFGSLGLQALQKLNTLGSKIWRWSWWNG